ncbi:MAG: ABC transporter permease subunit [Dehalococcoidia bacterium]|nr:ABC transporter permease subunit [Dehalococcoidia bacterium]
MAEQANSPTGSIYDLGYRPHEGERLGRAYATFALFVYSLRGVFGLGRSALSKVFSMGLAVVALVPAAIQLGIAAIAPLELEIIPPEEYFSFVQIVLALFCAVVAPEIIGRDQRNRTLPLYFSRALSRPDYVTSKLGALAAGVFIVVGLPQVILLLGSAVATDDVVSYLGDNAGDLPPILGGSLLVAVFFATVSLTIASQTPRRAFATGGVLAYFVIFTILGSILVNTTSGTVQDYSVLISPIDVLDGSVHWLFGAQPPSDSDLVHSGLAGGVYVLAAFAYIGAALGLLFRRFMRLTV